MEVCYLVAVEQSSDDWHKESQIVDDSASGMLTNCLHVRQRGSLTVDGNVSMLQCSPGQHPSQLLQTWAPLRRSSRTWYSISAYLCEPCGRNQATLYSLPTRLIGFGGSALPQRKPTKCPPHKTLTLFPPKRDLHRRDMHAEFLSPRSSRLHSNQVFHLLVFEAFTFLPALGSSDRGACIGCSMAMHFDVTQAPEAAPIRTGFDSVK